MKTIIALITFACAYVMWKERQEYKNMEEEDAREHRLALRRQAANDRILFLQRQYSKTLLSQEISQYEYDQAMTANLKALNELYSEIR